MPKTEKYITGLRWLLELQECANHPAMLYNLFIFLGSCAATGHNIAFIGRTHGSLLKWLLHAATILQHPEKQDSSVLQATFRERNDRHPQQASLTPFLHEATDVQRGGQQTGSILQGTRQGRHGRRLNQTLLT